MKNTFARDRKSLPNKLDGQKSPRQMQGSPKIKFAPNCLRLGRYGAGRFGTDNRRAFSLGVPVPPGPLP